MNHALGHLKAWKWAREALFAAALLIAFGAALADGFIKSPELLEKIRVGATTSQEVKELLGPPAKVQAFARRQVEAWDYRMQEWGKNVTISIEIDSRGIVSNVERIVRYGP